ncbi:MAG: SH3 domain-containing protein [Chloroflexales bacterium]|nr:SH3 domain-containing protein [Chloroflexales bacterium]
MSPQPPSPPHSERGCLHSPLVALFVAPVIVALITAYLLQDGPFAPEESPVVQPIVITVAVPSIEEQRAPKDGVGAPAPEPTAQAQPAQPAPTATTQQLAITAAPAARGSGSAGDICDTATVVGVVALSIREAPTRQSARLGEVSAGSPVSILCGAPIAADDRVWLRVRAGQVEGYMSDRYLSLAGHPTAGDVCGSATVVDVAALSIRAEPSRQSAQVGAISAGSPVSILCGAPIAADERVWLRVRAGQVEGYMSDRYLRLDNE